MTKHLKSLVAFSALAVAIAAPLGNEAQARFHGGVSIGIGIPAGGYGYGAYPGYAYAAPEPYYYPAPAPYPVYYGPPRQRVVYAPAPVYAAPYPVYTGPAYAPPAYGYYR